MVTFNFLFNKYKSAKNTFKRKYLNDNYTFEIIKKKLCALKSLYLTKKISNKNEKLLV